MQVADCNLDPREVDDDLAVSALENVQERIRSTEQELSDIKFKVVLFSWSQLELDVNVWYIARYIQKLWLHEDVSSKYTKTSWSQPLRTFQAKTFSADMHVLLAFLISERCSMQLKLDVEKRRLSDLRAALTPSKSINISGDQNLFCQVQYFS